MSRYQYGPPAKSYTGILFLVVVGLVALPFAVKALLALLHFLVIVGLIGCVVGGFVIRRRNYF